MPRDFDFDFEDDDLMQPRRQPVQRQPRQPQPRQMQGGGVSGATAPMRVPSRKKKNQTRSIIILAVEIVLFIALLVVFFVLKNKIDNGDAKTEASSATESSQEAGEGGSSGGVNVDGPNFTLTCSKVQLANDVNNSPAALIYFTFVNKTDAPLSMNEVFTPAVKQAGVDCPIDAQLPDEIPEIANHDTQIQSGASIECCYAVGLQDFTSTLTLTIHDNYETFSDIGSTDIPLS